MSESRKFTVSDVKMDSGTIIFTLSGSHEYGLDKSVANAIRRTLLTDIPTVAFEVDEGEKSDITMVKNDTVLHNEMLSHRIGLLPLYLNPDTFQRNYLFECKVKHDTDAPFQFVTANEIEIYPLKSHMIQKLQQIRDSDDINERESFRETLDACDPDNYDFRKPLSQSEKDKIFRPYIFRKQKHYCMLNELKSTHTPGTYQQLHFYGSPSVKTAKDNGRYQAVSQACYSFLKDDNLFQQTLKEKIEINAIPQDKIDEFKTKMTLAESERYYYRDKDGEPYRYQFSVKSCHYWDSSDLVKRSLEILMNRCHEIKQGFLYLLQEKESSISVSEDKEGLKYKYTLYNQGHTMGSLIQSHIARRCIRPGPDSLLNLCGYKMPHPLTPEIVLFVTLNPKHKAYKQESSQVLQTLTSYLMDQMEEIRNQLKEISDVLKKEL